MTSFTRDTFLQKFQLSPLLASEHTFIFNPAKSKKKLSQAAVLVPIIDHQDHLTVLLTRRSSHLRHHAGQVSFPGGKVDDSDINLQHTALREAFEEINLAPENVEIIGQLKPYQTITGFSVTPIIAIVPNTLSFTANQGEVSEIFEVPLAHFLAKDNTHQFHVKRHNQTYPLTFMPYQHYNIWGATAAILNDLVNHLR
jgi:8-oxo-dGTP pyrophosphatase MutT (NUDIX family)